MQKLKKKLNAKFVGVDAHIDPLNQNGITLIALIITIIVMMILVGLTISVALNGGIFSTADEATTKKEKNLIYEQIVGAMQLTNNGKIIVDDTYGKVVEMYGDDKVRPINQTTVNEETTEVTFTVTGKKGTYTYKITGTKIEMPQEKNTGTSRSIYDVAYICTDTDKDTGEIAHYMYVIRENNKIYSLPFNEDFTEFVDKCEVAELRIGSKEDYSELISQAVPDVDFETGFRDEVILWKEDDGKDSTDLWMLFIIIDNQEILSDGKGEYIRNDEFDVSSIDFDAIDSNYDKGDDK